jgi:hypothetical protein
MSIGHTPCLCCDNCYNNFLRVSVILHTSGSRTARSRGGRSVATFKSYDYALGIKANHQPFINIKHIKGITMNKRSVINYLRFIISVITSVVFFAAFFSAGFLVIMMTQQSTNAQIGGRGEEMLKIEERSASAVVSVAQPGAALTDVEKHVGGVQQNLDTPEKVQAATSGS